MKLKMTAQIHTSKNLLLVSIRQRKLNGHLAKIRRLESDFL